MKFRNTFLLIIGCLAFFKMEAQDRHFTQFYMIPQALNPALAGKFEGTVRLGGIYRDQWRSVIGSGAYSTPSAFVDAPILRGLRKKDWIGVGISVFQDKAGTLGLTTTGLKLGATYNLALDKKRNSVLSFGYHFGGEQRGLNEDAAVFLDELKSGNPNTSQDYKDLLANVQNKTTKKIKDSGAGICLTSKINKTTEINVGFAIYHLLIPRYSIVGDATKQPNRYVFHGQFQTALNKEWTLTPQFLFQTSGGAREIMVQGIAGYEFDKKKHVFLDGGLGWRLGDAVAILLGGRYKDLKVGFAYDVNTSSLRTESNKRGGFEIGAQYVIRIYKPPVRKVKVLCPRF